MLISSFNCGLAREEEVETASTEEGEISAVNGPPRARKRWVNSIISSRVGVGLCSSILSFREGGRPFENCLVSNAVLASFVSVGSAFERRFSSSHLYTDGSSCVRKMRCSNAAKKFSRFARGQRACRMDFTAFAYVFLSSSGMA